LVDAEGHPLALVITGAATHDQKAAEELIDSVSVGRKKRPEVISADKGYDSIPLRKALTSRRIKANIPEREAKNQKRIRHRRGRKPKVLKVLYKTRFVVERTFAWLNGRFRRLRIRYRHHIQITH